MLVYLIHLPTADCFWIVYQSSSLNTNTLIANYKLVLWNSGHTTMYMNAARIIVMVFLYLF